MGEQTVLGPKPKTPQEKIASHLSKSREEFIPSAWVNREAYEEAFAAIEEIAIALIGILDQQQEAKAEKKPGKKSKKKSKR